MALTSIAHIIMETMDTKLYKAAIDNNQRPYYSLPRVKGIVEVVIPPVPYGTAVLGGGAKNSSAI
jgi:hypothetical protein